MKLLRKSMLLTAVLGTTSLVYGANTPFAGMWKVNLEKSILVGDTVKFSSAGDAMRMTSGGDSYEFKTDGSESKTKFGAASWKKIDDKTWEETDMVNATSIQKLPGHFPATVRS